MSPISRIVTVLLGFLVLPLPAIAETPTVLILNSQAGDGVGNGQYKKLTPASGKFNVSGSATDGAHVRFSGGAEWWTLDFTPPAGKSFGIGEYDNASRFPFNEGSPGLDVSGDGVGCNTLNGRFVVSDFALDNTTHRVTRLAIDFEQHCDGAKPALFGSVRYKSAVPLTPTISIGNAVVRKGSAGTSDGQVLVGLSMPSETPITVHFRTADGTAIIGRDYLATTGMVRFSPGETVQYATVPIVGDVAARGTTAFSVKLNHPSGATIAVPDGEVKILDPNAAVSALWMNSSRGDYIGGGIQQLITDQDGAFNVSGSSNGLAVRPDTPANWTFDFYAPYKKPMVPGLYANAQRYPFETRKNPGLSVYGDGRGCNTLSGEFTVNTYDLVGSTTVNAFSANFTQRCEVRGAPLFGAISYNVPLQQVSITNAVIEGNHAIFKVTLNPASTTKQTVSFKTVGSSAVAGVDFTAVDKTLVFEPGQKLQAVSVPIDRHAVAGKVFFAQISTPGVMPVWVGQGVARP